MSTYWRDGDIRGYTTEELITLYLGEHPEDDRGVGSHIYADDGSGPHDVMTCPVAIRFSKWGVANGYFDKENSDRFMALLKETKA